MNEDGALFDSGFDGGRGFPVSPEFGGISLEAALRDFGPAAIDDLIPRLRTISARLDAAHGSGVVHGALHPSKVFVTDEATSVIAGPSTPPRASDAPVAPYAAPEVLAGDAAGPRADQFALAAIAYEWLFGRPVSGPADRAIDVRAMPGIDRAALSKAFSRALSRDPWDRFASCSDFVDAVAASTVPELPLIAAADEEEDDPVEPFIPEEEMPLASADMAEVHTPPAVEATPALGTAPNPDDLKIVAEETNMTAAQPDLDAIDQTVATPFIREAVKQTEPEPVPVASWNPPAAVRHDEGQRFGAVALILATIVGAVFGFAAGYMAKPRALQTAAPQEIHVAAQSANGASGASSAPQASETPKSAAPAVEAPKPAEAVGRLLVRSSPSGASVTVDGVAKGTTPLALRDLAEGTRTVVVARRGYVSETHKVQITSARPARTLDVKLDAEAPRAASPKPAGTSSPRPSTPATLGKSAGPSRATSRDGATTGGLIVESRPTGANVAINGRDRGKTPLTIDDLAPGEYRIVMTLPGYRNVATTVRVVAGERARAAASLTAVEQE